MDANYRFSIPAGVAVVCLAALLIWWQTAPLADLQARVPGLDRSPDGALTQVPEGSPAQVINGKGTPANLPGSWPSFRGADQTNVAPEKVSLIRSWPPGGPKVLWSVSLGEGHAGPVVHQGRVYILDYDREASADALRCLSLADGQEIWRNSYPVLIKRNHGMSRTVPAVGGSCVVTLGPKCHVSCVDALTGERRWMIDLVKQYGTIVPQWYAGQCPLIDGEVVVLAPGGKEALLVGVDLKTGQERWRTPNPRGWKMTHSSIMPQTIEGRKTYVYCASGGVVGVEAKTGVPLWDTTEWTISIATVPSPVCLADGRIFLSGGYNAGALMLQVKEEGGALAVKTLFRLKARQFGSTQQTPIRYGDHLFGVREDDKELVCLNLNGQVAWRSGPGHRFSLGRGPYLLADGLILVLSEEGELAMVEANPAGYKELGRAKVLEGPDAWGPMAFAAGRLLARDVGRMVCLDVKQP